MTDFEKLYQAFHAMTGMPEEDCNLSEDYWKPREYKKGEFYNEYKQVCKYLGFIIEGVFRTYYVDDKTGEEKNVFFFSANQLVVSFKSFISQGPCNYYTQSLTESKILYIHTDDLNRLYKRSHSWEHWGRLVAELAFSVSMDRTESFLFQTPEQRYLQLLEQHPDIFQSVPLYQVSSYLGIQGPSLSRIRRRLAGK